jgi:ribosomal protein L18E
MASVPMPYKLQIFVSQELRRDLKNLAHKKNTSLQKLVVALLDVSTQEAAEVVLPEVDKYLSKDS